MPAKPSVQSDLRDNIRKFYETHYRAVSPWPTRKVRRPKRWWVLEIVETCSECERHDYRLVWPWVTTYDDVPRFFLDALTSGWVTTEITG